MSKITTYTVLDSNNQVAYEGTDELSADTVYCMLIALADPQIDSGRKPTLKTTTQENTND